MTQDEFKKTFKNDALLTGFSELQLALWHAGNDNWEEAHEIVRTHEGETDFDHLHAYLHRVEGDEPNARYWYKRAGTSMPAKTLEQEFDLLIKMWA